MSNSSEGEKAPKTFPETVYGSSLVPRAPPGDYASGGRFGGPIQSQNASSLEAGRESYFGGPVIKLVEIS